MTDHCGGRENVVLRMDGVARYHPEHYAELLPHGSFVVVSFLLDCAE